MSKAQEGKRSKFLKKIVPKSQQSSHSLIISKPFPQINSQISPHIGINKQTNVPIKINSKKLRQFIVLGKCKKQIIIIAHPQINNIIGLVDQHAVHERIRYQYYSYVLKQNQSKQSQFLERNIQKKCNNKGDSRYTAMDVLGGTITNLLYICKYQQWMLANYTLQKWGIKLIISFDGVYMQSYHVLLGKKLQNQLLKNIGMQILLNERNGMSERVPDTLDYIIGQVACKSAVKFNQQITMEWCYQILHNISVCEFPWYCVHGRPTIQFRDISAEQLQLHNNRCGGQVETGSRYSLL